MAIDFDHERAAQLMDIMHKVANIAPKATSILGLAQRELNDLNDQAKEIAAEMAAADEEKRAAAAAAEADKKRVADEAKAKADADAAAKLKPALKPADDTTTLADRRA